MILGNVLLSGLTLALAAVSVAMAVRAHRRERSREALGWLLCLALVLRVFCALDGHLHAWDERYHALVAKNLLDHPLRPTLYEHPVLPFDYRDWLHNHVWLHKQPLALWLISLAIAVFGAAPFVVRLPSIVLSLVAVGCSYELGRRWRGPQVGWVAGFFHAINGFLIELTSGRQPTDHVDATFIALVQLGITVAVLWVPGRPRSGVGYVLSVGVLGGLAALAKSPVAALLFLVAAPVVAARGRRGVLSLGAAAVISVLVYLPWQLYVARAFPLEAAWENAYTVLHLTEVLEGHSGGWAFHLVRIPRFFGEASPVVLILWLVWRWRPDRPAAALVIWLAVPYLFFSFAATKMPAYPMVAAPAFCLILADVVAMARERLRATTDRRIRWALIGLVVVTLGLPVRYGLERVKPFRAAARKGAFVERHRALAPQLDDGSVVFNEPHPIELMFRTGATAYAETPDRDVIDDLLVSGRTVVVIEDGDLPDWLSALPCSRTLGSAWICVE